MQPCQQIWHSRVPPLDVAGELQKNGQPDCPICLIPYNNIFKTPKLLECSHVFCLECLSRIMAASWTYHRDGGTHLCCPYCRQPTPLPENGPPGLPTCRETLCKLPSHQQREEPVWLQADKLCYDSSRQNFAWGAPDSSMSLCIGIDIEAAKQMNAPNTWSAPHVPYTLIEDKRVLLVFLLFLLGMLIFVFLVLMDCFKTTRNANCENALP